MAVDFLPLKDLSNMSEQKTEYNDGLADAWAGVAVITLVVATAVYWLSGMPS